MAHKEFQVALDTNRDDTVAVEPVTFTLTGDDYTYTARTAYKEDAIALVIARLQRSKGLAAITNLEDTIRLILEPAAADHLFSRVTDPRDGLKLEHIGPVVDWVAEQIMEARSGRPTESQPA